MEVVAVVQEAQVAPAELADQQMADTLAQTEAARPAGPVEAVVAGVAAVVGEASSSAAAAADAEAAAAAAAEAQAATAAAAAEAEAEAAAERRAGKRVAVELRVDRPGESGGPTLVQLHLSTATTAASVCCRM